MTAPQGGTGDRGEGALRVEDTLRGTSVDVRAILERALAGRETRIEDGVRLCRATGVDLTALAAVADHLRREQVGEAVTYVVNRNVNFTNVCVKTCKFCAFSRLQRSEEAYFLDEDEVIRRVLEAQSLGATEVCIQAGLAPKMNGREYATLCRAIKRAAPAIDIHAFSPEEIKYGAGLAKMPYRAYLEELRDAGLGSLPGTSAEILDDSVRARIAPGRISTAEWIDVIRTAHTLGIPTTSTMMFGHVETDEERVRHLATLRSIQHETGGFTEFVPLSFVHQEAPLFAKATGEAMRPGPTGNDVRRLFAVTRLMLGRSVKNLQVSWVKEGLRFGQVLLESGANDLGGTLMNESISTAAGAGHGQLASPAELRRIARDCGRPPVQRDTRYRALKTFPLIPADLEAEREALDCVDDPEARFGTFATMTHDDRFRFHLSRAKREGGGAKVDDSPTG